MLIKDTNWQLLSFIYQICKIEIWGTFLKRHFYESCLSYHISHVFSPGGPVFSKDPFFRMSIFSQTHGPVKIQFIQK